MRSNNKIQNYNALLCSIYESYVTVSLYINERYHSIE